MSDTFAMQCIVIRHVAFEDLGCWESTLAARGVEVRYLEAGVDDLAPFATADLGMVLGGPIGVGDAADFPTIGAEIELISRRLRDDRPTLGVCLGLQLMAAALGAEVTSGEVEFGWHDIAVLPDAGGTAVRHVAGTPMLMWHGDRAQLPAGATLLARSAASDVAAFSVGRSLAVQFHPEIDHARFEQWIIGNMKELREMGVDIPRFRAEVAHRGPESVAASRAMLGAWLDDAVPA